MSEEARGGSLGFAGTWSLAAGGMVGGGIYIALGVVVAVAGQWAWASFALAGAVAACTSFSYVQLATEFGESGGAFEFLREIDREGAAGTVSWLLVVGYVLTMALYAYAFGHYLAHALGAGPWAIRLLAIGVVGGLVGLNLAGAGSAKRVEIGIVWANLLVLAALAVLGLTRWDPVQLVAGLEPRPWWSVPIGAAAIFVSYEGFQLLTYEYHEIEEPKETLPPAIFSAVAFVVAVYVAVALGATVLAGGATVVEEKQVALAIAGREGAGTAGLVAVTAAAGFATAAAINSTLFSTARLVRRVADDGELPKWFEHRNSNDVPDRAVVCLGALSALLAVTGSLSALVEAASLVFLVAFGSANVIAWRRMEERRWIPMLGIVLGALIAVVLVARLAVMAPVPLAILVLVGLGTVFGRRALLEEVETE